MLFFCPHSLTYFSLNHLSYAGTKCAHWIIFKVFFAEALLDLGTNMLGPAVANAPAVVVLIKSRRVIRLPAIASLPSISDLGCLRNLNHFVAMMGIWFFDMLARRMLTMNREPELAATQCFQGTAG